MNPPEPRTNVRWRIVALLMSLCFISHFNRSSMSVAGTDRIMDQFGIDPVRMGSVYSAFLLVYSILMIPGGIFIDRFGPRRALMVVGFGSAILGAFTGFTGWWFHTGVSLVFALVLVRGTMGALSAPLHPAAARAVGNWFPFSERSLANGTVTAAAILGVGISYPGFGALIKAFDWPAAFAISGFVTALLTGLWMTQARDWPRQHPSVNEAEEALIGNDRLVQSLESKVLSRELIGNETTRITSDDSNNEGWATLLRNRNLILVTLSYATVGYFQYLFVYWMQYYFEKVLHLGGDASKYYAGFLQLALAAGMPLGGWLSSKLTRSLGVRRGRGYVAGGGMILSATLLGLGVLSREPFWIVVWFALAHAAIGASEGPIWATAVDIGGRKGGTAAAICNTGGNVGGMIAPVLTPFISSQLGWSWGIGIGGVICFLGAICWRWIDPLRENVPSTLQVRA